MITTATKITIARLALVPIFVVFAVINLPYHMLTAGLIYAVVAITDILDGLIARRTHTVSKLGKILDPIADKVLQIAGLMCVICLELYDFEGYPIIQMLAIIFASVIIGREILISVMRIIVLRQGLALSSDIFGKLKTIFLNISVPVAFLSCTLYNEFGYTDVRSLVFKGIAISTFIIAFVLTVISAIRFFVSNKEVLKNAINALHQEK